MVDVCKQIVAEIFEPQGITFMDTNVTFMTNDLLPLVRKSVTDKKVKKLIKLLIAFTHGLTVMRHITLKNK